ncbi:DUF2510 domain-containing protein [Aquihabitans sp. McL0605]|uniref:DUF2510 domain-containing protein n=1 Tax=Aquihabitans sp. McL0605 TaxID=3415671 RepID=UPI003CF1A597
MHEEMAGQTVQAGWYPDPQVAGTIRYWDGATWSDHTATGYGSAPAGPVAGSVPGYGMPQQRSYVAPRRSFTQANRQSLIAIGVGVAYLALAMTVGIVFLGIIPVMASFQAFSRKEPLAPVALLVGIGSAALGVMAILH